MGILRFQITNLAGNNRIIPVIISFTLLFSLLIIAITPPATGYELSIYGAYPSLLWILISINIFFSLFVIFAVHEGRSTNWIFGYISIINVQMIILLLPLARGYYSMSRGGGDIYYHLSVASSISNVGYLPEMDIYPAIHILTSILNLAQIDWIRLALMLSAIFYYLYVLYLYILGKILLGTIRGGLFVSVFGLPLIYSFLHFAFQPFFLALMTVPLILYVYHKIKVTQYHNHFYVCLVLLSLFVVFCHPTITILLLSSFSIFIIYEFWKKRESYQIKKNVAVNIVAILFISFSIWLIKNIYLLNTTQSILTSMTSQNDINTIADSQSNIIMTYNSSLWLIIERYIKVYGSVTVYFLIASMFLIYIMVQYYRQNKLRDNDLIYEMQLFGAITTGIGIAFGHFWINEPIRAMSYGVLFATIICGIFLYRTWTSDNLRKRMSFIFSITLLMSFICILCVFNVYQSPWKGGPNTALSFEDKTGFDWILDYQNAAIPIVREESTARYSIYHYGILNIDDITASPEYVGIIPSNFGYNMTSTIGRAFSDLHSNNAYMVTTKIMELTPKAASEEVRDEKKQFTNDAFLQLNNDPSVDLLYSNKELMVWNIDILPKNHA